MYSRDCETVRRRQETRDELARSRFGRLERIWTRSSLGRCSRKAMVENIRFVRVTCGGVKGEDDGEGEDEG